MAHNSVLDRIWDIGAIQILDNTDMAVISREQGAPYRSVAKARMEARLANRMAGLRRGAVRPPGCRSERQCPETLVH